MTEDERPDITDEQIRACTEVVDAAPGIRLMACRECGAYLWNVDTHYYALHPDLHATIFPD